MLASARSQYDQQVATAERAVRLARREPTRGGVIRVLGRHQARAAHEALASLPLMLAEQGLRAPAQASVSPASLTTDPLVASGLLDQIDVDWQFDRLIRSLVLDAARTATSVGTAVRPALTGYIRALSPPSCSRCAVLAGRIYRYSTGFQRHPGCDCVMQPTTEAVGPQYITSPAEAYQRGQITDLSHADRKAIDVGADIRQVVNVRRAAAGLSVGSSVASRAGRLTPYGVFRAAGADRNRAIELLGRYGYIT